MKIKSVYIKNFRGIGEMSEPIEFADLNVFIGDNGTCKTAILEAINFCLSPGYITSRFNITDFHKGTEDSIEVTVEFTEPFFAKLPDGYATQEVECNKITLIVKKRERATPGKAFSDLVTMTHYVVPVAERQEKGWTLKRRSYTDFSFNERQLSLSNISAELPKAFYFSKNRHRQLVRGYNSSFSNIIDDLNWRFEKGQRGKEELEHFKTARKGFHETVIGNTAGDTLSLTIDTANEILDELGVAQIDMSLVKTLTPFSNAEIVFPFDGFEIPVESGGSGIEMAVSIALLEAMANVSKGSIILVIDEPELHMHPKLQAKLFEHLKSKCSNIQIFVSTHSPFLFKNLYREMNVKMLVLKKDDDGQIGIHDARTAGFGLLKWSPSWGEVCYLAYDLPTIEFHDDLYSAIEDRIKKKPEDRISQQEFEEHIFDIKPLTTKIKWPDPVKGPKEESIMTFVRNRIHHPDNTNRPQVTSEQLQESIQAMIDIVRTP